MEMDTNGFPMSEYPYSGTFPVGFPAGVGMAADGTEPSCPSFDSLTEDERERLIMRYREERKL